jgi:hypothetical protein
MAIDTDYVYMTWEDETPGGYGKAADIYFNKSYDYGQTWDKPVDVWKDTGTHSEINVVKFNSEGDLFITWEKGFNNTVQNVYFTRSFDNGATWPFIKNLTGIDDNFSGQPQFSNGEELGYFIWQDENTGRWHILWNPDGNIHNFQGTITTDGLFTHVNTLDFEQSDYMDYDDKIISFDAKANKYSDGLDFNVEPPISRLIFDITIDKKYDRHKIFIGEASVHPRSISSSGGLR